MSSPGGYQGGRGRPQQGGGGVIKPRVAPQAGGPDRNQPPSVKCYFDPSKPKVDLLDDLAEKQAEALPGDLASNQVRRFFGDIKEMYNRFQNQTRTKRPKEKERIYKESFAPLFKMLRSKVVYAKRAKGPLSGRSEGFADFLSHGISKVENAEQFRLFVMHLEAVVGFMYGHGKVKK
ncbi:MAG: type III-A CRISPR-associated protein Csm2 [Planctomycetota bacterium]